MRKTYVYFVSYAHVATPEFQASGFGWGQVEMLRLIQTGEDILEVNEFLDEKAGHKVVVINFQLLRMVEHSQ